jgi:hypothetical protein
MPDTDIALMAHLMRRAGMGATRDELEALVEKGYEAVVDDLVHPERFSHGSPDVVHPYLHGPLPEEPATDDNEDILLRYYRGIGSPGAPSTAKWIFQMVNSKRPLKEKIGLFWHQVFACAPSKSAHPRTNRRQLEMFRRVGMSDFRNILLELSKDPSMLFWLDNNENHKDEPNENYGRELLELFSMGVGNYTEADVKSSAYAFTGWSFVQPAHGAVPYGKWATEFEFREADHDFGEKTFLGVTGALDGTDVIDTVVDQPATARFISRHLYNFFVADEPAVAGWNEIPPQDPAAIDTLMAAYFESGGSIAHMLQVLFNSDFFKEARFKRVKNPTELVGGVVKLIGTYREPNPGMDRYSSAAALMGQLLMSPLTVEGWPSGAGWINGGTLNERVNFAVEEFSDPDKPGIRSIIDRLQGVNGNTLTPTELVDNCLDLIGPLEVEVETRQELIAEADVLGDVVFNGNRERTDDRIVHMLQLIVSTREFQFG